MRPSLLKGRHDREVEGCAGLGPGTYFFDDGEESSFDVYIILGTGLEELDPQLRSQLGPLVVGHPPVVDVDLVADQHHPCVSTRLPGTESQLHSICLAQ